MAKFWCGLLFIIVFRVTHETVAPPSSLKSYPKPARRMMKSKYEPGVVPSGAVQKCSDAHYCEIDKNHFMCTTKGFNSFHPDCTDFNMFPREDVRLEMDAVFNQLRNRYAHGERPGDSFPVPISDMQGLEWDDELACLAERWAMQCPSKTAEHGDVERFKVAQIVAFLSGKTVPTTQRVLAELMDDNHTFHLKGPPNEKLNTLYTATSQYNQAKPMSILTNPHVRYFGCAAATMYQKEEGQAKKGRRTRFRRKLRRNRKSKKKLWRRKGPKGGKKTEEAVTVKLPQTPTFEETTKMKSAQPRKLDLNEMPPETGYQVSGYLHKTVIVCNFGPIEEPYEVNQKVGTVCTACAEDLTCYPGSSYSGLCIKKFFEPMPVRPKPVNSLSATHKTETRNTCPFVCGNGVPHTVCLYSGPTREFDNVIPASGPTTTSYILVWHNLLRDAVAAGRHNLDIPLAANMRELVWNKRLEDSAMLWASQCLPYPHPCNDELFPGDDKVTFVNQLVTRKPWNLEKDGFPSFEDDILAEWGEGFKFVTPEDVDYFSTELKEEPMYVHFAQMIWAETYMLGCAMTLCRNFGHKITTPTVTTLNHGSDVFLKQRRAGEEIHINLNSSVHESEESTTESVQYDSFIVAVCNYAPGGALEGNNIYDVGGPCTSCEKIDLGRAGTRGLWCSDEFPHLCAAQNDSSEGLKLNNLDSVVHKDIKKRVGRYARKPSKQFRNEILFQGPSTPQNTTDVTSSGTVTNMTTTPNHLTATATVRSTQATVFGSATVSNTTVATTTAPGSPRGGTTCEQTHKCYDEHLVHTHCKYKVVAKFCEDHDLITSSLSQTRFLNLHNNLRGLIATGPTEEGTPFSKFPRAGNMRKMIWDRQLEASAKEWALQCMDGTDECRDRNYPENSCIPFDTNPSDVPYKCLLRANQLVATKEFDPSNGTATPSSEEFFEMWKNQVNNFDPTDLVKVYVPDPKYDNFAQLIWARTFLMGCVYVTYYKYDRNVSRVRIARLVCNYAPAGLLEARSVYKIGGACTRCEKIYQQGAGGLYCSYPLGLCDQGDKFHWQQPDRAMSAQPYYDPNAQYAAQYDPNDPYAAQYAENDPYAAEYAENDPYAAEYAESDPYATQYEGSDPYASGYDQNEPYPSEYEQFPGPYAEPEAPYEPPYQEPPYEDPGVSAVASAATPTTPTRASSGGDPEYYVSLEPCARGSSCSMYDSVNPKCMIRLVGKGYQKDIELSLDSKMDSLVYRIFRCLEDEGICLDGVRLQGLPKKNCLKNCLAALCAPFTALCSGPLMKPVCCQSHPRPCCCTPSTCPKRSMNIHPRRSSLSARYSLTSRRPSLSSTYSRRRRSGRRRPSNYRRPSNHRRPSNCHRPCRMARVCQGPGKDDCVLIKISPSLPQLGGVKCEKRSTGVGTDEFPELEILLQGGKKKRGAVKNKGKICVCPHCCSSGKIKVIKCRSRMPKRKEPRKENHKERPRERELPKREEEDLMNWPEEPASKPLDQMSEGELDSLLGRLEREDDRFSFGQPPPPHSSVNFVLVDSQANLFQKSDFILSESHLVVPNKVDVCAKSEDSKCEIKSIEYDAPLKVCSMHQQNGGQMCVVTTEHSSSAKKKRKRSDPEAALLLREVLYLAHEILKNQKGKNHRESPKVSHSVRNEKQGETLQKARTENELNPIFRRSDLWLSGSDSASKVSPTNPAILIASPITTTRPRHFSSSKSINFVARLGKSYRRRKSPKKSMQDKTESPSGSRNQEQPNDKFKKLRIYLETDKKDKPAEFVPVELTKKDASVHLNTLIR